MQLSTALIIMPLAEQRGGAELALLQLLSVDSTVKWHVVFLEPGPMVESVRRIRVGVSVVDAGRLRNPLKLLNTIRKIAKVARQVDAEGVLSWMSKAHLYGGPAAILAGVPSFWFQHGLPNPRSMIDLLIARIPTRGILTCSRFVANAQAQLSPNQRITVAHPAVDLWRFDAVRSRSAVECRSSLGLPFGKPLIGIVGRFQRWKGMHVLVEAMPTILEKRSDAYAVIVGGEWPLEPDYETYLRNRVGELGLQTQVIFAGHQKNVSEWMQACDVIVHASDREPFGMVIVEAMALGKPVVAGAEGGPREIITDGVDGLLAPFGDASALAKAVLRFLDDPAYAGEVGRRAAERARYFSVERFVQGVTNVLSDVSVSRGELAYKYA